MNDKAIQARQERAPIRRCPHVVQSAKHLGVRFRSPGSRGQSHERSGKLGTQERPGKTMGSQVLKREKMEGLNTSLDCENYIVIRTRCTFSFRNMMASATVSEPCDLASRTPMRLVSSDVERSE